MALPPQNDRQAGPALALLAKGLELWLRRQCQEVEELELQLAGSLSQLLQGKVQGVSLRARRVVFQNLCLEQVALASDPIRLKLSGLLASQNLQLEHPFLVRGSVVFSAEGLSRSLSMPEWQELTDALCKQILGGGTLEGVQLKDGRLILQTTPHQGEELEALETRIERTATGLQVCPLQGGAPFPIPLDEAITLERAEVHAGGLEFAGVARVQP